MSHHFSPTSLKATKKGAFSLKFNHICLFNGITGPRAKNTQSPPRRCVAVGASRFTAASRRRRRPDTVIKLLEASATTELLFPSLCNDSPQILAPPGHGIHPVLVEAP